MRLLPHLPRLLFKREGNKNKKHTQLILKFQQNYVCRISQNITKTETLSECLRPNINKWLFYPKFSLATIHFYNVQTILFYCHHILTTSDKLSAQVIKSDETIGYDSIAINMPSTL